MACISLICGVPGSGKTEIVSFMKTRRKDLFKITKDNNRCDNSVEFNGSEVEPEIHIIAFDDLCSIEDQARISKTVNGWRNFRIQIMQAAERYICAANNIECLVQGPLTLRSEELLQKLEDLNDCGLARCSPTKPKIFLVEDNFYYRSMRYEWFQIARRGNIGFCQIFLTCPLNVALQRNQTRNHVIPERLIKIMYNSLELPDAAKNKWEKFSLLYENTDMLEISKVIDIATLIRKAIDQPAEMVVNENRFIAQDICSKNVTHQVDRILRRLTGVIIKETQGNCRPEVVAVTTSKIISIRQKILSEIKQKTLILPHELTEHIQNLGINTNDASEQLEAILQEVLKQKVVAHLS